MEIDYAIAYYVGEDLILVTIFKKKFVGIEALRCEQPIVGNVLFQTRPPQSVFYLVKKELSSSKPT